MAYWYIERYLIYYAGTVNLRALRLQEDLVSKSFRGHHCVNFELLVVIEYLLKPVEVKAVTNVLFVYLAEELMVLQVAEPTDPAVALLGAVGAAL